MTMTMLATKRTSTRPPSPRPFVLAKECPCGARYDEDGWRELPYVGVMPDGRGGSLVLRNCLAWTRDANGKQIICASTLVRPSDAEVAP